MTALTDASGFKGEADAVFTPADETELARLLAEANRDRVPVTILGAGTGITGGSMPKNGWSISMRKFAGIEIEPGRAITGAGVALTELQAAAARSGQFYAPDPTEWTASVGGTINTNASGSRSFLYGSTRRHVLALKVVFMDGRIREFRRDEPVDFPVPALPLPASTKSSAGYPLRPGMDWIDLICGSEGTLAVITEAALRLLPKLRRLLAGVVFFRDEDSALDAVGDWRSIAGERMLEYMDARSLELLRPAYEEIPMEARAAVLIEQEDGDPADWVERLERARALMEASWFGETDRDRERFRVFRHALPERVNATVIQRGFMKLGTDFAVPLPRGREMLAYCRRRLSESYGGDYVVYGHAGDAHLHINMLPATSEENRSGFALMTDFARKAVEFGGTVSAEHGLGKRKAHFLEIQYTPEQLEEMKKVKRRLDPNWLLGQGNLFPVPSA
jgi:FAD/FMN-containing dehydrogenase